MKNKIDAYALYECPGKGYFAACYDKEKDAYKLMAKPIVHDDGITGEVDSYQWWPTVEALVEEYCPEAHFVRGS